MLFTWVWNETSPASATSAASSNVVQGSANYAPVGIGAGDMGSGDVWALDIIATFGGKTAAGASTGGTVDLVIETTSTNLGPGSTQQVWTELVRFTQATANAAASSFRVQVGLVGQPASAAPVAVKSGTVVSAPVLAQTTAVQALGFSQVRLVMTGGTGTSGGSPVTVIMTGMRTSHGSI